MKSSVTTSLEQLRCHELASHVSRFDAVGIIHPVLLRPFAGEWVARQSDFRLTRVNDFAPDHILTEQDLAKLQVSTKIICIQEQIEKHKHIIANEEDMLEQLNKRLDELKEEGLHL